MASESIPPPSSGGGAKMAIAGIALLAIAGGVGYCALGTSETPTTVADVPDAAVERPSTALVDETLEIPEEEPDAWMETPDAGPAPRTTPRGPAPATWDCEGELDRGQSQSAIAQFRPQIQACYERRLKQQPMLQGNMSLQLRIGASGGVDAVQTSGSLRDREVFSCVRTVATQMHFPRPTGGNCAVLAVPFSFAPQN